MSPHPPADPADGRADGTPLPASPSRRRFVRTVGLGAAAVGAAAATGASLTGVAGAAEAGGGGGGGGGGGSSETPELSAPDVELVRFLQSVSLAGATVCQVSTQDPGLASPIAEQLRQFAKHHSDHAEDLGSLLAEEQQVTEPNPTLTSSTTSAVLNSTGQEILLGQLLEFEEEVASTMLASLGEAESFVVAAEISKLLPIVAQQAAAIGQFLDAPIDTWLPSFGTTDGALTPAQYPLS